MPIGLKEVPYNKKPTIEVGSTGTIFQGGFITGTEYNPALRGASGLRIFDEMRVDAQVAATLLAITLPIIQANWQVTPYSKDKRDMEISEFVNHNLFHGSISWTNFLEQVLLHLSFGFMVFEKVMRIGTEKDSKYKGKVLLDKLSPRLPRSIFKWIVEKNGDLISIIQYVKKGESNWEYVPIKAGDLLLFTRAKEGSNYAGRSVLRPAYRPWYIKSNLIKLDAIKHDRFAIGIPVISLPADLDKDDPNYSLAVTTAKNMRAHQSAYIIQPFGYEIKLLSMAEGSGTDILSSVKYHDEQIAKNVLAQFMSLGSTKSGSRNLGENFQNFFLLSIHSIVNYIVDVMNKSCIRPLVDDNYKNVFHYPSLGASKIETANFSRMADAVVKLVQSDVLTNDEGLEKHVREVGRLPKLMEDRPTRRPEKKQAPEQTKEFANRGQNTEETSKKLNGTTTRLVSKIKSKVQSQFEYLVTNTFESSNKIRMGANRYMASLVSGELQDIFRYGCYSILQNNVEAVFGGAAGGGKSSSQQLEVFVPDGYRDYFESIATDLAHAVAHKFEQECLMAYNTLWKDGNDVEEAKGSLLTMLNKIDFDDIHNIAASYLLQSFNMARSWQAANYGDNFITHCVFSTEFENNPCDRCSSLDGNIYNYVDLKEKGTSFLTCKNHCSNHLLYLTQAEMIRRRDVDV